MVDGMSQSDGEPSQTIGRSKRPARVVLSESEGEEDSPRASARRKSKRPRSSAVEDEGSDDAVEDLVSDEEEENTRRKKKGKGKDAAPPANEEDDEEGEGEEGDETMNGHAGEEGQDADAPLYFRPEYERGADGFVAGSIVRIKLRNFMTYDFVEFRPGPHLNMILGPNGSGKSSVAAAIAIGLGFHPKIMGRANELRLYVKQNTEDAETEIELKGRKGRRNTIIKRRFNRANDTSEWILNGQPSTKKAVTDLVLSLGVQANNLCSFLPQDKVAEFAKMAPDVVLRETMRAAGDPRLIQWHDTLIEKGKVLIDLEEASQENVKRRETVQQLVDRMEPDVQNVRNRRDQEFERDILRILVPGQEAIEVGVEITNLKASRRRLVSRLKVLKEKRRPLTDLEEHLQHRRQKAETKVAAADDQMKDFEKKCNGINRRHVEASRQCEEVKSDWKSLNTRLKRKDDEKNRYRRQIETAQEILDRPRDALDNELKAKSEQRKAVLVKAQQIRDDGREVTDRQESLQNELRDINTAIDRLSRRQGDLASLEKQRENNARDFDGSINYALDWLEKNAMKLEGTVHKPPMISVNVIDPKVAWQVEACTNVGQRKTFICENRHDYDLLIALNGTEYPARINTRTQAHIPGGRVRLHSAVVAVTDKAVNPERPCSIDKLKELGFEGFAIDMIDTAPAVRAYLNEQARMYQAAISSKHGSHFDGNVVTAAGIRTWITSSDINRVPARAFNFAIDVEHVKRVENELAEKKRARTEREKPLAELQKELLTHRRKLNEVQNESQAINDRIAKIREELQHHSKAKHDLDVANRKLDDLENEKSAEEQREEIRKIRIRMTKKYMAPLRDLTVATEEVMETASAAGKALLQAMQCRVDVAAVEERMRVGDDRSVRLTDQIKDYDSQKTELDLAQGRLRKEFDSLVRSAHRTVREAASERAKEKLSLVDLRSRLQEIEHELDLIIGVDPEIVARYERASKELAELNRKIAEQEATTVGSKKKIDKILASFNPALDALVEVVSKKFASAFERVGCTGEVKVDREASDYANWGISILVSYRDGDHLQRLTGSLQSGGERSLATVTYLMSLSEMARTPFSLVDEINQGMDQRAERNVHNQLVEVTCAPDAGQYFLITPKLLTGLRYHRNMKILIVNNGSWLPNARDDTKKFGDLKSCLQKYKQQHVAAH